MVCINADFYPDKFISMSVAEETKKNPSWVEPALQGLAFWLGYRKQLFRHHDLPEGALVAELSTIMYAHIGEDEILECEYPYSGLIADPDLSRVDIALLRGDVPHTFIEVKRGKAPARLIEDDIKKLARIKESNPEIRCFLIIGSQGRLPGRYVDRDSGKAIRGIQETSDAMKFRVSRVCKAAASFEKKESAMYVCLVEVL
jgi:hypothetical protein